MTGPRVPLIDRLERMSMAEPNSGCVLWLGYIDPKGYGRISVSPERKGKLAHVVAYEVYVGPVPEGKELDHLCRNRACRAIWHLEPVTRRVNQLRGNTFTARNAQATECLRGHPFSETNTRLYLGKRHCLICQRIRTRECRARRKLLAAATHRPSDAPAAQQQQAGGRG